VFNSGEGLPVGIVTALKQQTRNPGRVNVFIDSEFRMGLPKVVAARLRVGQELSEDELQELLYEEAFEVAYRRALQFIGRRQHTTEEIRMKLRRKQVQDDVIEKVVERLEERTLLDDLNFAHAWVENRQVFRPRGRKVLRLELRKKGVSREHIEEVLKGFDDEEAAYRAAEKAFPRYQSLPRKVAKQRFLAYLARRGFAYGLSRKVVEATLNNALVSVEESEVER
jgi:regulatory protein